MNTAFIYFGQIDDIPAVSAIGGKGRNLALLQKATGRVPSFMVVTTAVCKQFRENGVISEDVQQAISAQIKRWGVAYVAVRSSAINEDSKDASFAGMYESFLYVSQEQVIEKVKACFASAHSDRIKAYQEHKNQHEIADVAVVIQAMVDSDKSGVAFSRSPIENSALMAIDAGYGLGEGVVAGLVPVDSYFVDRTLVCVKEHVACKNRKITKGLYSGTREEEVALDLQNVPVLSEVEIKELGLMLMSLEKHMHGPVDVEWGIAQNELYLLQVRPITQEFSAIRVYVDTNLSESYPGVVSPLSGEFIERAYTKVIGEIFSIFPYSKKERHKLEDALRHLVKSIGGHMYYDLQSYYRVLSYMPGGAKNIENWHRMIGGHVGELVVYEKEFLSSWRDFRVKMAIVKLFVFHDRTFRKLLGQWEETLKAWDLHIERMQSSREAFAFVREKFVSLEGFGLTAINDLLIMITLKAVTKYVELVSKVYPNASISEASIPDLIKTDVGVKSIEPLEALKSLALDLNRYPGFFTAFSEALKIPQTFDDLNPYKDVNSYLVEKGFGEAVKKMSVYLKLFGERSFEELKLCRLTFQQSPAEFYQMLQFVAKNPSSSLSLAQQKKVDLSKLPFLARKVMEILLYFAHKTIAMREYTRLKRGRFYNRVRRAYLRGFTCLQKEFPEHFGHLSIEAMFGLTMSDIDLYLDHPENDVKDTLLKHADFAWHKRPKVTYPEFYATDDQKSPPYFAEAAQSDADVGKTSAALKGLTAAKGKVTGKALVIHDPREALGYDDLSEMILITANTDPAWVFIMSRCRGLVSEKGSLLSHTAIIGRELAIPTLVGVKGAMAQFKTMDLVTLDGHSGTLHKEQP